jgi:PAS domain S-box-containing protein
LVLAAVVVLFLSDPSVWGFGLTSPWAPQLGVGLALLAWLGRRAVWLILGVGLLSKLPWLLLVLNSPTGDLRTALGLAVGDTLLSTLELATLWWLYAVGARGGRGLADPRSAILFLVLGPGLTASAFALARAAWVRLWTSGALAFGPLTGILWMAHALGLLILAPPLLVWLTPLLVRRGLTPPDVVADEPASHRSDEIGARLTHGDFIEMLGLAAGASLVTLLLTLQATGRDLTGWPAWGLPLLFIVWACLRQGLRGGTVVASCAGALPLLLVMSGASSVSTPMLQANLLAQGSIALLIAASATYLQTSEARYRQVVGHIPVVVYSARVLAPSQGVRPPHAEVTLVSAASEKLLGCDPGQLLGDHQRWQRLVHPDDWEVVVAALTQLSRQNAPVTCEYRLATGKLAWGSDPTAPPSPPLAIAPPPVRWMRDTMAPRLDADGGLIGWEGVITEISEQRALADDLRRTTSMFHALVAHLPMGVFFVQGPMGQPILVNARARSLLGRREDSTAGLDRLAQVYRLFRADGSAYPVEELPVYQSLRRGVAAMRDDIVVHRPDGRRVPLITWAAPVQMGGVGPTDAAVWVLEDLTALHQAEAARRDSEGRLRAVIETMAEGVIVQDRHGEVLDSNPAACAILGQPPDRLRGQRLFIPDWVCIREDGSSLADEELPSAVALRLGRPVRNVVLGIRGQASGDRNQLPKEGSKKTNPRTPDRCPLTPVRWLLVSSMPLGQGPAGVVTTFADITAYRQAQEGIRLSEEKYRGLVESLPLMVIRVNREGRLTFANPATRVISGFELDEIADPTLWCALVDPADRPRVNAALAETLRGQETRGEVRFRAKDGSPKTAFYINYPLCDGEMVIGATSLIVDVTRERLLEQELQRAQRLELIGRLSSGVAHDFNNLLCVILALTDTIRERLPADDPCQADLKRLADAGEQAASVARQLLAFSKQRRPAHRPVDVNRVARRTLELLRATLPGSIRVEQSLDRNDQCVQGDETQLQQVLMNLCLNARDAMPQGGRLRVWTETVTGSGTVECVRLSVEDTGCGIDETVRARLFDPFFSTKEHGTGLGLAVVQQIVQGHGGRVEVVSHPGAGARFDVWLPRFVGEWTN